MIQKLSYSYHMRLNFEMPVKEHYFKLRCFPSSDERQTILNEHIEIYPAHFRSTKTDSFGNMCIYGTAKQLHDHFSVDVSGEADIDINGMLRAEEYKTSIFKYETPLTKAGESIREFHRTLEPAALYATRYERSVYMMNALYDEFTYHQGVTQISTSAEQAFYLGRGVCQDYAHIMLALCRLERIPCRYIAGMITGEGATHAWVEVYEGGIWHPVDPTHNRECNGNYIKISSGRDALDCSINQGVFTGGGRQSQEVSVKVDILN